MSLQKKDIRWEQRFSNYRKAFLQLKKFIDKGNLTDLEQQGLIKAFEYTYELGWNSLKEYLEFQGITDMTGARDTIREAYKTGLISDGEGWMEMLSSRNRTSHTYNEDIAKEIANAVVNAYFTLFIALEEKMKSLASRNGQ